MKLKLPILPKRITHLLLFIVFGLALASNIGRLTGHERIFLLNAEANIPTWYQSTALLSSAILLAFISWVKRENNDNAWRNWLFLAFIFLFLAVDEAASIHEGLNELSEILGTSGFLRYAWIIPVGISLIILTAFYWRFLFSLPNRTRNLFFVAGAVFIGGALGLEAVGGFLSERYADGSLPHIIVTTVEETAEMLGIVTFIYALLDYLRTEIGTADIHIQFKQE